MSNGAMVPLNEPEPASNTSEKFAVFVSFKVFKVVEEIDGDVMAVVGIIWPVEILFDMPPPAS